MHETIESIEWRAMVHMFMIKFLTCHFCWACVLFGPTFRALVDYHLEKGSMPLHDAVGVNCKKGATTENQGAGAGCIWAKWCVFGDWASVFRLKMTTPP